MLSFFNCFYYSFQLTQSQKNYYEIKNYIKKTNNIAL